MFFVVAFLLLRYSVSEELKQTNLLFIMHDDLRPQLPTYGADYMITPNYDKLASKSVVFDYAYCQVAVCNPSRDSMMTGLRPDTVGTYNFQHTYDPHLVFPMKLVAAGYNTAMFGKVLHWPNEDRRIWNFEHWENGWYEYQSKETAYMNASVMPDKVLPEENFRDALYADKAVKSLNKMVDQNKPFMLSIGFKLPHIELHVPYKHYELYKNKSDTWQLTRNELRFPPTAHEASYRCCADINYRFMHEEGAKPAIKSVRLGNINSVLPGEMHDELMATYCASISYLDVQLGKLLDVMDARNLWQNTTVILTSDHGMHLGEKGLW